MSPRAPRRAWISVLILLTALGLALSARRVPEGNIGILPGGRVLAPGIHLGLPWKQPALVGAGPMTVTGSLTVDTPEGARLAVPYRVEFHIDPQGLVDLAGHPESGSPLPRWGQAAEAAIRQAASGAGFAVLRAGPGTEAALRALRERPPFPGSRVLDLRLGAAATSDRRGRPMPSALILVGLDGADWLVIEPLMEAGKLPNLERLVRSGARASLRSASPLLSPLLWTSIATGLPPDRHGIVDFTVYDPATRDRAPISSRARRAPALWNILTAYGLRSAWLGWWASWPAEPVGGVLVSDRMAYSLFAADGGEGLDGKVYPPEAWPELRALATTAAQVPWDDLRRFVSLTPPEVARLRNRPSPRSGEEFNDRLDHLRQILASTRTYFAQARWARERLHPDVLAVYFQGVDEVQHRFMHFVPPPRMPLSADDVRRYGGAVEAFYREQDRLLGALLAPAPGPAPPVVMVVSDHGFLSGAARPPRPADEFEGGAADWHRLHGIFVLSGPGIRSADLGTASIYDVFPTLLYLCGIPIPEGLPGRTLAEAFEPSYRGSHPEEKIAALDVPFGPEGGESPPLPEPERAEAMARLRALGYVGSSPAGAGGTGNGTWGAAPEGSGTRSGLPGLRNEFLTAHMNLGTLYAERGDWQRAAAEYGSVAERFPTYAPALYKLMESEFHLRRVDEAWKAAERLLKLEPRPLEWLPAIAEVAAAAGRSAPLRAELEKEVRSGSAADQACVLSALGILELKAGRTPEASALLSRALEDDPFRSEALEALFSLASSPGDRARLIPILRRALERAPRSVFHLNYLGGLLVSAGRCAEARPYLRTALEQDPDSAPAHTNLARCLAAEGKVDEAASLLERGLASVPEDLSLLTTLGALEAGRGRFARGIELLEKAHALAPSDTAILNALGLARLQNDQPDQARELLRRSLEVNPDQPDVRSLLARVPG